MKTTLLASHFNIYLNLEASLHSIITVICINPYSPNKLIATKYCFLILGDDTSFVFLIFFCYFTLLLIFKKLFYFYFFFPMKIIFIFSCSGMFRNIPECSVFRVLSTPRFFMVKKELSNVERRKNLTTDHDEQRNDVVRMFYFFA